MTRYIRAAGAQLTFLYSNTFLYAEDVEIGVTGGTTFVDWVLWRSTHSSYAYSPSNFSCKMSEEDIEELWLTVFVFICSIKSIVVSYVCVCARDYERYQVWMSRNISFMSVPFVALAWQRELLTVQPIMRRVVPSAIYIIPGNFTILPRCQEKAHIYPHSSSGLCFKINNL